MLFVATNIRDLGYSVMENIYTFESDRERLTVDVILSGNFKLIRRPETNRIAIFATEKGEVVYTFHSGNVGNGNVAGIVIVQCTQDIPRWHGWHLGFCGEGWINSHDTTKSSMVSILLCTYNTVTLEVTMPEQHINTTGHEGAYRRLIPPT